MLDDRAAYVSEFDRLVSRIPDFGSGLWRYQRAVAEDLLGRLGASRFVVVMMPTGSGKTLLEVLVAWTLRRWGFRVLVLEPTRFLVDQAAKKTWRPLLGEVDVGAAMMGKCDEYEAGVVVSTPQTALKCVDHLASDDVALVADEVHHAFSSKYYSELVARLRPEFLVGFTALVPTNRRLRLPEAISRVMGEPSYLVYDFAALERLGDYTAPKAILDVYDAELTDRLQELYLRLYLNMFEDVERRLQSFLANTLMRYGLDAYCESLCRALERGRLDEPSARELLAPCLHGSVDNHKIKTLLAALSDYWDESLKPVVIFTSRVSTARRAAELVSNMDLEDRQLRVSLLTGQTTREERLRILDEARKGAMDVIVSTRVGEEGVDLPEAGMLVLLDTSAAPLRFYQRLGRLIRKSRRPLKHLVGIYTVDTNEYETLPRGVANLQSEGVDVSYVIANLDEKDLYKALKNYLKAIVGNVRQFPELLTSLDRQKLNDTLDDYLYGRMSCREVYDHVKRYLEKARIYREVWNMIRDGHLAYYLDPASASKILAAEILASLVELVSKYKRGEPTHGDVAFADNTLRINLREIYTILRSKSVQSTQSVVIPIERAGEEAKRLTSEIEAEYEQLSSYIRDIRAERKIRRPSLMSRKSPKASLRVEVEINGDGTLAEGLSMYADRQATPKGLELSFKVSRLGIYGFKERPPWEYRACLCSGGLHELIFDATVRGIRMIEVPCREEELPPDSLKLILVARSQILAVLRALKIILENI